MEGLQAHISRVFLIIDSLETLVHFVQMWAVAFFKPIPLYILLLNIHFQKKHNEISSQGHQDLQNMAYWTCLHMRLHLQYGLNFACVILMKATQIPVKICITSFYM